MARKNEVIPGKSIDQFYLGMSLEQLKRNLGPNPTIYQDSKESWRIEQKPYRFVLDKEENRKQYPLPTSVFIPKKVIDFAILRMLLKTLKRFII